jgi:predicted transposase YbfD/YdcC
MDDPAAPPDDTAETVDGDHGRIEVRKACVLGDIAFLQAQHQWPGLAAIGKITASREMEGQTSEATRYYLLSKSMSAARLAEVVRTHWSIENGLHWVLDVVMNEDQARNRKDNRPENLTMLRKLARNILQNSSDKASIRGKIKKAGWDNKFLLSLLAQNHMR